MADGILWQLAARAGQNAFANGPDAFAQGLEWRRNQDMQNTRKSVLQQLASGQDPFDTQTGGVGQLIRKGDLQGAAALAGIADKINGSNSVYGTPVYVRRPDGTIGISSFDKRGQYRDIPTPPGTTILPGIRTIDTATGTQVIDSKGGAPVGGSPVQQGQPYQSGGVGQGAPVASQPGYYPKDLAGKGRQEAVGKDQAALMNGKIKNEQALVQLESQWKLVDDSINKALDGIDWTKSGFIGGITSGIPGTPAYDLANVLETIKANIGFDKLQSMRENSPTGGALGQVSDFENRLLQSVRGALQQGQSPTQLRANLKRVQSDMRSLQDEKRKAFQQTYGGVPTVSSGETGFPGQGGGAPGGASIPQGAINALRAQPQRRQEFDAKFGPGAAAQVLGQ